MTSDLDPGLGLPPEGYRARRILFALLVGLTVTAGAGLMAATSVPAGSTPGTP
jgi:hypothetical protein